MALVKHLNERDTGHFPESRATPIPFPISPFVLRPSAIFFCYFCIVSCRIPEVHFFAPRHGVTMQVCGTVGRTCYDN